MSSSTKESAEAIMICVDNSYWMESTKSPMFKEQADAIENYCNNKLKSHSLVGICSLVSPDPLSLTIPTHDIKSIMDAVNGVWIGGRMNFESAVSDAHSGFLADLFRPMQKRIVFFVGCPVYLSMDEMCMFGRRFKELNLACDVITFGDPYYQKSKMLKGLIDSANNKSNCNICVVPPESSISEAIQSSPIISPPPAGGRRISSPPPSAEIVVYVKASSDGTDVNTDCPFCQRVLLTLEQKKLVYNTSSVCLEKKPKWFDETWTLPFIVFGDRTWAPDSNVIVEMIEKKHPNTAIVNPTHFAHLGLKILPKLLPFLKKDSNDTRQDLLWELDVLEAHLSDNEGPYVNGKDVSAVDLSLAPKLYHLVEACLQFHGWDILEKFPKVLDYKQSLKNLESFQKTKPTAKNVYEGWLQKAIQPEFQQFCLEEFKEAPKVANEARVVEVKRDDSLHGELFSESPSKEVIEKVRKDIFGTWLDKQVSTEKDALLVRSDWHIYRPLVADHMCQILRGGVDPVATKLKLNKKVFLACVWKYFAEFANTCPLEALKVIVQHKGFFDEKKWNERDENERKEYHNELEWRLLLAIPVINDLKSETFQNILSNRKISQETLHYYINLFVGFGMAVLKGVHVLHQEDTKTTPKCA